MASLVVNDLKTNGSVRLRIRFTVFLSPRGWSMLETSAQVEEGRPCPGGTNFGKSSDSCAISRALISPAPSVSSFIRSAHRRSSTVTAWLEGRTGTQIEISKVCQKQSSHLVSSAESP